MTVSHEKASSQTLRRACSGVQVKGRSAGTDDRCEEALLPTSTRFALAAMTLVRVLVADVET